MAIPVQKIFFIPFTYYYPQSGTTIYADHWMHLEEMRHTNVCAIS